MIAAIKRKSGSPSDASEKIEKRRKVQMQDGDSKSVEIKHTVDDIENCCDLIPSSDARAGFSEDDDVENIFRKLLTWYDRSRRKLPWRGDEGPYTGVEDVLKTCEPSKSKDTSTKLVLLSAPQTRRVAPYATWVSEIMLQQTRVDTVIDYFNRWMKRFPDIETLAKASDDDVNKAWVGLGYYRRARLLRNGAKYVVDNFNGEMPSTLDELKKIPGIGPYTAGAIASIAFARRRAVVDGNVIRVLSRLRALAGNPKSTALKNTCWSVASAVVDRPSLLRPGDFNQALMELGATICTPGQKKPRCDLCPIADYCRARAEVSTDSKRKYVVVDCTSSDDERKTALQRGAHVTKYPLPFVRPKPKPQNRAVAVILCKGKVLLLKRPKTGLLAGQWEFPAVTVPVDANAKTIDTSSKHDNSALPPPSAAARRNALRGLLTAHLGPSLPEDGKREAVGMISHTFSHLKHLMYVDLVEYDGSAGTFDATRADDESLAEARWVSLLSLETQTRKSEGFVPLTKGMQKVVAKVTKYRSKKMKKGSAMGFWKKWSKSKS